MDLFLVKQTTPTTMNTKMLLIAAAGVLGLYGLLKLISSSEDEDKSHSESQQRESKKPAGIYNQGNTCFVNSLLQALASLKSFQQNLAEVISQFKSRPDKQEELLLELSAVMDKINGNSQSISVQHLLQLINDVKEGLINLEQQDAHQLYAAIVGCFQSALNKQKRVDLSSSAKFDRPEEEMIENRLMGFTKSSITCTSCNNQTAIKIHPFYDLSLEVRPHYVVDIRTALLQFQRQERIESWTCTSCTIHRHIRRLRAAMKGLKGPNKDQLTFVGEAIIQHLQRSDNLQDDIGEVNQNLADFVHSYLEAYQQMEGDPQRDMIFVEMEGVQTTITKRTVITKYPKVLVIHLKQLVINPLTGQPQLLRKHIGFDESLSVRVKGGEKNYQLTSLLTHIGNESMGHYFTFRRESRNSENWFMISDSCSKRCLWDYVRASRAYILFFQAD